MNILIKLICWAYIAFSVLCIVLAVCAYFDISIDGVFSRLKKGGTHGK